MSKKKVIVNATFEYQEFLKLWTLTQCTCEGELDGLSHLPGPLPNVSNKQFIEISGLKIEI